MTRFGSLFAGNRTGGEYDAFDLWFAVCGYRWFSTSASSGPVCSANGRWKLTTRRDGCLEDDGPMCPDTATCEIAEGVTLSGLT